MKLETTPAGRPILTAPIIFGLRPFPGVVKPKMVIVDIGGAASAYNLDFYPDLAEIIADYDAVPWKLNQPPWVYDEAHGWILTKFGGTR